MVCLRVGGGGLGGWGGTQGILLSQSLPGVEDTVGSMAVGHSKKV